MMKRRSESAPLSGGLLSFMGKVEIQKKHRKGEKKKENPVSHVNCAQREGRAESLHSGLT